MAAAQRGADARQRLQCGRVRGVDVQRCAPAGAPPPVPAVIETTSGPADSPTAGTHRRAPSLSGSARLSRTRSASAVRPPAALTASATRLAVGSSCSPGPDDGPDHVHHDPPRIRRKWRGRRGNGDRPGHGKDRDRVRAGRRTKRPPAPCRSCDDAERTHHDRRGRHAEPVGQRARQRYGELAPAVAARGRYGELAPAVAGG